MGQAHRNPYLFESRWDPASMRRTPSVGVKCKKCDKEEWHPAPNPGWGRRIFRNRGWILGNGPGTHVCPTCESFRRHGIHKRPEPAYEGQVVHLLSPREQRGGADVHQEIVDFLPPPFVEEAAASASLAAPLPVNDAMAAALAPVKAAMEAKVKKVKQRGKPTGYSTEGNAAWTARQRLKALGVKEPYLRGTHYTTFKEPEGTYGWSLLGEGWNREHPKNEPQTISEPGTTYVSGRPNRVSPTGRRIDPTAVIKRSLAPGVPGSGRGNVRKSAIRRVLLLGRTVATEGVDYRLVNTTNGWVYELLGDLALNPDKAAPRATPQDALVEQAITHVNVSSGGPRTEAKTSYVVSTEPTNASTLHDLYVQATTKPESAVSDASTQAVRDHEERPSTLSDNRRIRAELDGLYNEEEGHYQGDWSDQKLADKLDVPRIWVTRIRELYGPDKNDSERLKREAHAKGLVVLAEKAAAAKVLVNNIIDQGAKLETLMAEIEAKKKELGL